MSELPYFQTPRRFTNLLIFVGVGLLAGGCSTTLIVEGKFPEPLVDKLPLNVGVFYSDEFRQWQYTEDSEERAKWIVMMGDAQLQMYQHVLPGMFAQVTEIDAMPQPGINLPFDMVIIPLTEEFQYTLPSESRVSVFEVWLKYNLQVTRSDGSLLADWIVTAYGKTPEGFIQSDEAALNQAVVVALRDAGANLALNFRRVPEIRDWLESRE